MAATPGVLERLTARRRDMESLVAQVAAGRLSLAEVLSRSDHDATYGFVYLVKIAESLPGIGKVRARRVLADFALGERTRVSEVPLSTRAPLVAALCETPSAASSAAR
jgi:hypothetical protein